jgi:two-component system chemotaxis sensor kinase CheA
VSQFDREIIQDFLTEGGELLERLDQDLVQLESTPRDPEMLNAVFRALHTIKGSASFLALTELVSVAHAAESALNAARSGVVVVDRAAMDLILGAVDVLRRQFDNLRAGEPLVSADPALVAALTAIGEGRAPSSLQPAVAATATAAATAAAAPAADQASVTEPAPSTERIHREPADEAPASAAEASPAAGMTASAPGAPAVSREPLKLDESKSTLIEFLVSDVRDTLAQAEQAAALLADEAQRSAGAGKLGELGESLARSARFFEFEQMNMLADALSKVGAEADRLEAEQVAQVAPRVAGVLELLREQADGLAFATVIKRPIDGLCAAIAQVLGDGHAPAGRELPATATATDALAADGVIPAGTAPAASTSTATPAASAPPAPAVESAATEPAPTPAPEPAPAAAQPVVATTPVPAATPAPAPTASVTPTTPAAPAAPAPAAAKPEPKPGEHAEAGAPVGAEQTIRVEVGRLESLLNLVGELVLQKNRLSAIARSAQSQGLGGPEFQETFATATGNLDRVTGDIQVAVMRTRMQPLDKLFGKYPRLIRDLARKTGKEIRLVIEGGDTEVDKSVIEELGDPLVHILRNSADHGVEPPADRRAAGKPEQGTITLRASHEGSFVMVTIQDDGRGLSRKRIGAKAVERGLVTEQALAKMSDQDVHMFIFAAGFSTAEKVTDLSGRGVGMDVVRTNIEKIKGSIELDSVEGKGTTIRIKIPLTVAILTAMMVRIAGETYAVPLASIVEIVRPEGAQLSSIQGTPVMRLRDAVLPLLSGSEVFGVAPEKRAAEPFAVIIALGEKRVGLMVSGLIGQQEVVIKPLDEMVDRAGPVSGATVRDDGGVSLIVDVNRMVRLAEDRAGNLAALSAHADAPRPAAPGQNQVSVRERAPAAVKS